jgi:DUF1680 family protein
MSAQLPSGASVRLVQITDYPATGVIRLHVETAATEPLSLKLRIPHGSSHTRVMVNGEEVAEVAAGH